MDDVALVGMHIMPGHNTLYEKGCGWYLQLRQFLVFLYFYCGDFEATEVKLKISMLYQESNMGLPGFETSELYHCR